MENNPIEILVHGGVAIIDSKDFENVSSFKWYINNGGYVANDSKPRKLLHRFLLNPPKNMQIDHINSKRFDCRRSNMRVVTTQDNSLNKNYRGTKSGFKGVYWDKSKKSWLASIQFRNKQIHLGRFKNPLNAFLVRIKKEIELFGKFSNLTEIEKFKNLIKLRNGVSIAYIAQGKPLNDVTKDEIRNWVKFIIEEL